MVSNSLTKRPLNLRKDFEQIVTLLELVFAKEIEARGMNIRSELSNYKRILPLLNVLGLVSPSFRYSFNGFIFETEEGQIIASVNTSSIANKWEISMVATHPDYRRRGLAKELVSDVITFIKDKKGNICTLEVISDNTPAYNLYRDLGFIHYDSIAEMKLSPNNWPNIIDAKIPEEYNMTQIKRDNKTNMQRYELKVKETPKEVQQFLPIDKKRYKSSKLKNFLRPIMIRLFSIKINSWIIYFQDELVGYIFVEIDKSRKNPHRIELVIDPDHQGILAKFMISFALSKIEGSGLTDQNSLIAVRSTNDELVDLLNEMGFTTVENNHKLGLRLKPTYF